MRDLNLPARIRAKGVPVVLVAGWETRGNASGFNPIGSVNHHTAGSSRGATPSLSTNIYGRPDVPGPLCQVMQSREPNAIDKAYVIASGKANHGGVGTWSGPGGTMNSNYESYGLEIEHTGTATVPVARLETAARIQAAFLEATPTRSAGMCCQHFEYARPAGRKIDFFDLAPYNRDTFRDRVRFWIGRTTSTIPPEGGFLADLTDAQQKEIYNWVKGIAVSTVPLYQDAQPTDARFQVQQLVAEAVDNRFATGGSATRIQLVGEHDNDPKGLIEYALERSEKFAALEAKVDHIIQLLHTPTG